MINQKAIISSDPEIMSGMLVFTGTRVPVAILIQHLTAGDSLETFLDDFPSVTKEQAISFLEIALTEVENSNARAA
ncbi:hypothetical protein C7H19_20580 [Aphanothece hegewaldii CCALA 016]|uniref:DUF433 domain-containing protein n=1 Tax=Aphanothece hegewaldii CCALA 016 TaxID=2107694 RepID=A0A2T1LSQ8_9CHRO|nr:DUF433 domain-containing protein [Aphanothece hegewaldii]PSF33092.1 hypothetical protein C7H19_20580 [Aphanothece hegewaldii CCALA 016]